MLTKYALPVLRPFQISVSKSPRKCIPYCTRTDPDQSSTVYRGTLFENRSMALLERHLSMSLKRVGGRGDGGVDILGWWWVPHVLHNAPSVDQRRRIRVIAQCKAESKKIGPKYIRELEGVLQRYYTSSLPSETPSADGFLPKPLAIAPSHISRDTHAPAVGLFISESPYTKATILCAQSSSIPLLLLHLPPEDQNLTSSRNDILCTAIWNPALAGDRGLLGGQMEIRWERSPKGPDRPALWWRNTKLPSWAPDATGVHVEREEINIG